MVRLWGTVYPLTARIWDITIEKQKANSGQSPEKECGRSFPSFSRSEILVTVFVCSAGVVMLKSVVVIGPAELDRVVSKKQMQSQLRLVPGCGADSSLIQ